MRISIKKIGVTVVALKSRWPLWTWIAISIANVAVCDILNFEDMMWGNGALSSLFVSLAYLLVWIALVVINRRNRRFIIFFTLFASICTIAGLLGFGISLNMISSVILTSMGYLGLLFITPLYGFRFIIHSYITLYIALIALSAAGVVIGLILLKKQDQAEN
ncbi:MAG: hypothetical protein LBK69_03315 [Syntrophomonadaceae bacterium]|jgi:hypothetical protein|nr:hypothetical protein [Syntrophomonadaceae bacterium]